MKEIYSPYSEKLKQQEKEGKINSFKKAGKYLLLTAGFVGVGLLAADNKDEFVDVMSKAKAVAYETISDSMNNNETVISPENLIDSEIYTIQNGETLNAKSWQELEELSEKNQIDANAEFNGSDVNYKINRAQQMAADENGNVHAGDSFEMKIGKNGNGYDLTINPVE